MSNNHRNLSSEKLLRLFSSALDVEEPICVLIVDDSKTVRLRLCQYLAMLENVTVLEAGTLAEACAILQEHAQSLFCAVLDLTLPDADGLDVVEAVRGYRVPSIVLTGTADPSLCVRIVVASIES